VQPVFKHVQNLIPDEGAILPQVRAQLLQTGKSGLNHDYEII
jgi:hypothetical protein